MKGEINKSGMRTLNIEQSTLNAERRPRCSQFDVRCSMLNVQRSCFLSGCGGQALVEFVVALVVIMVLVAGTLQISLMGVRHSRLMAEARREAGQKAMQDVSSFSGPQYIGECTVGPDGIAYTRDDDATAGDSGAFVVGVVGYAQPTELDTIRPGSPVSAIADTAFPQLMFGLVQGEKTENLPLIPVVRELIYRKDAVELKGSAWMTWTKGLY